MIAFRLIAAATLAGSFLAASAQPAAAALSTAQTGYFTGTIPLADTEWAQSITIAKFNPALGTLTEVECYVNGSAQGEAAIENRSRTSAAQVTIQLKVQETLSKPDNSGPIVVTIPLINDARNLPVYDGVLDFGGTSGVTYPLTNATASNSNTLTAPADLAMFVAAAPGETVVLPMTAVGMSSFTGSGNLAGSVSSSAGAEAGCRYKYTFEAPDPVIPEFPAPALAAGAAALIGAGAIMYTRRRQLTHS